MASSAGVTSNSDGGPSATARTELVAWLSQPNAYREGPRDVTRVETHISWVFLTDRYAYKLKKPVKFDFLDYGTVEKRHQAAQDEVRLNRRLARDLYLGLVPITRDAQGRWQLGGTGTVVDWLVQMRRLRADHTLEQLIVSRQLDEYQVSQVAQLLTDFYLQSAPLMLRADEYLAAVERHVRANRAALLDPAVELPRNLIERVHTAQLRLLLVEPSLLTHRVCDGRIVEGHGDLRPEHICLLPEPLVFDCAEFNAEFRRLDVVDELGFLAMECDRLQAPSVGQQILEVYRERSGDRFPPRLLAFYKCYRACVRAKVDVLRAAQLPAHNGTIRAHAAALEQAREYLELADAYARQLGPASLISVGGLMGTGKSTLAHSLVEQLGATLLSTDEIRRQLGVPPQPGQAYAAGDYRPDQRQRVYDQLWRRAETLLTEGRTVVVDASLISASQRRMATELAAKTGAQSLVVHCQCPREVALARLATRAAAGAGDSDGHPGIFDQQAAAWEEDSSGPPLVEIDTTQPLFKQRSIIWQALGSAHDEPVGP